MTPERARLLIVDDELLIRKVLRALMLRVGFRDIDEACDGAEAIDLMNMRAYDVVLTDWNMPHVSGLELLKTIRHSTTKRQTAVVLLSGEVSQRRRVEAIDCGADAFVEKPFVAASLCAQVARLVEELPAEPGRGRVAAEVSLSR